MWRHISAHRATTKYSSNSFLFRSKIEKEGLPRGSTPGLESSAQRLVGKLAHLPGEQERHPLEIVSSFVFLASDDSGDIQE
jgi:hypothetical protein